MVSAVGGNAVNHEASSIHVSVMPDETLEHLALPGPGDHWIVDLTVGAGGHAERVLEADERTKVLGLDQDEDVLAYAGRRLERFGERVRLVCARMSEAAAVLDEEQIEPAAFLMDLGANSYHFDQPERGFSFGADGPLDMRMDRSRARTAADIVNHWDEEDLADLLYHEGGERHSRKIARAIVESRRRAPFLRTSALADVIAQARGGASGRIHPATRSFQALRRAVNEEGEELLTGLNTVEERLLDGGRLVVISFHEGEDGSVKRYLQAQAREGLWEVVTKKPIAPSHTEVRANVRARSARLRAATRTRKEAAR